MREFLFELKNKYGYNEDLLKAIEITINLMIDKYGESEKNEIYNLFANTQIIILSEINKNTMTDLTNKMQSLNKHIRYDDTINPYETESVGSAYNYEPIFNLDMKVIDEKRCIVAKDMMGKYNENGYRQLFGTSINMPYFIHEANHAYAMMHPEYKYNDNKVIVKHGMYISMYEYEYDSEGKYIMHYDGARDIILEEMINERITQDMLVKLLNKEDYKEVKESLNKIDHDGTIYGSIMMTLGDLFIKKVGFEKIMDYRRNNNIDIVNNFNQIASQSDIALEYITEGTPYEYFSKKIKELFDLNVNKYKMKLEDYSYESAKIMIDAFAPISAYEEIMQHTTDKEKYNQIRERLLNSYSQYKKIA